MQHQNNRKPFPDPLEYVPKAFARMYSTWISRTYPFASIGNGSYFHFTSKMDRQRAGRIRLGNSVCLKEYTWLNVANDDPFGEPTIVMEDNTYLGFSSIISARNQIHLEPGVLVGQHVIIMDHNHLYEDVNVPIRDQGISEGGKIRIGQGSWIGHGAAIICPRGKLTLGRNCVVAANSVVMRSFPDYCVVAGYPAVVIKQYDLETRSWCLGPVPSRPKKAGVEQPDPV